MNELFVALPLAVVAASQLGVGYGRTRCGHGPLEVPEPVRYDGPVLPEPWRDTHPDALVVPVDVAFAFANPDTLNWQRRRDAARREKLHAEILADGQQDPLELTVDGAGRALLSDGNHRVVILRELGWPTTGVRIATSPKLRWGRPLSALFTDSALAGTLWR